MGRLPPINNVFFKRANFGQAVIRQVDFLQVVHVRGLWVDVLQKVAFCKRVNGQAGAKEPYKLPD